MHEIRSGIRKSSDAEAVELVAFGVILDDIVFPDGRTSMGVLGGGGTQTAIGMRIWSPSVGLAAGISGSDREHIIDWLRENRIDQGGIRISDLPTPRAWQLLEENGRRTQIWRVTGDVIRAQLSRSIDKLPSNYQRATGFHFGIHPDSFEHSGDIEFIRDLRRQGTIVSIESYKPAASIPRPDALFKMLSSADIFSANQEEAQSLVGEGDPLEQARRLAQAGGNKPTDRVIAIRLGVSGSLVLDVSTSESFHIPAFPTQVVDPIGAGNAYCGGFLAGWINNKDLRLAGIWGAVSASFMVEQVGIPKLTPEILVESRRREALLQSQGEC